MDFPLQYCIVTSDSLAAGQAKKLLGYQHGMTYVLLDLQKFDEQMQKQGKENILASCLSIQEQEHLGRFTSVKRKKEWLGGRFAAKYAAAGVLFQNKKVLSWPGLAVIADENGRPFLAADKATFLPDISISHSGDLAAAMAVSKGLCGIDIQKITDRVVKVRERFCTSSEEQIVHSLTGTPLEKQNSVLTKLWAAKEALRKVANTNSLPGFHELKLIDIDGVSSHKDLPPWRFSFTWQHLDMNGNRVKENCSVAVSLIEDYALALTARNDTVG